MQLRKVSLKTLKYELIYHRKFPNREIAKLEIFSYIEGFYHQKRIHTGLGNKTPNEMETFYKSNELLVAWKMSPLLSCNSTHRITEIAEAVGYKHATHFTNAFKKFFGYLPQSLKAAKVSLALISLAV